MAKNESIPRALQKAFLVMLFLGYLSQAVFSVGGIFQYFPDGQNVLPFYINIAQLVLVPLILFGAAWLISPRSVSRLGKAFESMVLAVIGFAAISVVGTAMTLLPPAVVGPVYAYPLVPILMPVVVAAGYIVVLLVLRQNRRWK